MNETLTIQEAIQRFHVSYQTLYRAVRAGKIRAFKPGKSILLDMGALNEWFRESEIRVARPVGRPRKRARRSL